MLKNKFSIITLLIVLILALTLPVVRADDDDIDTDDNAENQDVIATYENDLSEEQDSEYDLEPTSTDTEANFKKSDVYLYGDDITVDYIVDGNLFVCANSVTINSQIGGDAFIVAKSVTIDEEGYIFSNLFAVSENIDIKGVVYDLYSVSKTVDISGYIYRDIKVSTASLNILGTIGRNAFVQCSNINFNDKENDSDEDEQLSYIYTGRISGDLNYTSENELDIPEDAVTGDINFTQIVTTKSNTFGQYLSSLVRFATTAILIWLVGLWLSPKFIKSCDKILIQKPLPVIGFGLLTPIVLVIAFVLLLLLKITSSFAILLLPILFTLIGISSSVSVIAINNLICNKLKIEKTLIKLGILIATSIATWLICLIPFLGSLISFIFVIIGIGLIVSKLVLKKLP